MDLKAQIVSMQLVDDILKKVEIYRGSFCMCTICALNE
jgi:hypothetical protein